jgi:hypothetical protein
LGEIASEVAVGIVTIVSFSVFEALDMNPVEP